MKKFFKSTLPLARSNHIILSKNNGMIYQYSTSAKQSYDDIEVEDKKGCRIVTLNRPKALNALNLKQVRAMQPLYDTWNKDSISTTIILKGAETQKGPKAFCAGGDIVAIVKDKDPSFFKEEYKLNYTIGTMTKPHVAILDGITMGGGVGLSVHGLVRVATENTVFAMPETAIGFFTDVGGGYFLPRLNHNLGYYLGLTGARLKGQQLVTAGIATHFVPSEKLPELENMLVRLNSPNTVEVNAALKYNFSKYYNENDGEIKNLEDIERIFDPQTNPTIESIIAALEKEQTPFAEKTLKMLSGMSPTSLKVVYRQLQYGSKLDFSNIFRLEYAIAKRMLDVNPSDFFEGVRALLIDKDKNAQWSPDTLDKVTDEHVNSFFDVDVVKGLNTPNETL